MRRKAGQRAVLLDARQLTTAGFYSIASLFPSGHAAHQGRYVGYSIRSCDERRTGALLLGRSGAVEGGQLVGGQFGHAGGHFVLRHRDGPGDMLLSVGRLRPGVKDHGLASV